MVAALALAAPLPGAAAPRPVGQAPPAASAQLPPAAVALEVFPWRGHLGERGRTLPLGIAQTALEQRAWRRRAPRQALQLEEEENLAAGADRGADAVPGPPPPVELDTTTAIGADEDGAAIRQGVEPMPAIAARWSFWKAVLALAVSAAALVFAAGIVRELAGRGFFGKTADSPQSAVRDGSAGSTVAPDWLMLVLCLVNAVEGADIALLPSCMFALQGDLGLTPRELAIMGLWGALAMAVAAPLWGVLADRRVLTRRAILTLGCAGWGVATVLLAFIDAWVPMAALRMLNGAMLACLRPICNGLVPDVVEETRRGAAYGRLQLSFDAGCLLGAIVVTPMSTQVVFGVQGWRAAFASVGLLSLALAFLVGGTMPEPPPRAAEPKEEEDAVDSWMAVASQELRRLGGYLRTPTFTLIVLQGLFGMIPWNALGYLTLFLQTAGLSSYQAALVSALGRATQGAGHLLGGYVGDWAAVASPEHGRPFVAQVSVLAGIPLVWLLFVGVPPGPAAFGVYAAIYALLGLVATWCAAGVNWPMFTEIVPPDGRSVVVAWDTAFEGISGAVLGNLAVAFLAEDVFGYRLDADAASVATPENAVALGRALAWTTSAPFLLCLLSYSAMHWSYPRDLRALAARLRKRREAAGDSI